MSKLARVVDFQVYARPAGPGGEQRPINEALFSSYEPVRLWLKEHEIRAPFRKILVTVADEAAASQWHGHVANALGICEVTEAVALPALAANAGDHRWVLGIVQHALGSVARNLGWRSEELDVFVRAESSRTLPLVHVFEALAQIERSSGVRCVPWLSTQPGETQVGVRLGERDVTVVSKPGPLYLEDTFPLARTAIRGNEYLLLDKSGKTLAAIAIAALPLH